MKKHFAFIAPPKQGHVYPTLPLVEELVARGHRVTYVTGAPMLPTVVASGAIPFALPGDALAPPPPTAGKTFQFTAANFARMLLGTLQGAERAFPEILAHLQQEKPDAVCYDILSPVGPVLADALGVPGVLLGPSMADNEHFSMSTKMPASEDDAAESTADLFGQVIATYGRFRRSAGLSESGRPPLLGGTGKLNLVFIPRAFQIAGDTFDSSFRFLGPSLGARVQTDRWQPPANGKPVLFISLGTVFNRNLAFFTQCIEAFADSPWHVVMVAHQDLTLPPLPDNFEVAPSFPQLAVLAHAQVCLCHTGMNSTMESLYYGVPLVSVPQMPEQAVTGGRVEELGLGRKLDPKTMTAESLRKTVDEVAADPHIRANVARFRDELRAVDGAAVGADALEALVG